MEKAYSFLLLSYLGPTHLRDDHSDHDPPPSPSHIISSLYITRTRTNARTCSSIYVHILAGRGGAITEKIRGVLPFTVPHL
jgi:hypothetical protein